jgi:hypothetical protein
MVIEAYGVVYFGHNRISNTLEHNGHRTILVSTIGGWRQPTPRNIAAAVYNLRIQRKIHELIAHHRGSIDTIHVDFSPLL